MAALICDGFDFYDNADGSGDNCSTQAGWAVNLGTNCQATIVAGNTTGKQLRLRNYYNSSAKVSKSFPASDPIAFGAAITVVDSNTTGAALGVVELYSSATGTSVELRFQEDTNKLYLVSDESATEITQIGEYVEGVPQYVEITISGSAVELFINGTSQGTMTITAPGAAYDLVSFKAHQNVSNTGYFVEVYYDDIYLTDNVGTAFAGRLGPIAMIPLQPTADGAAYDDLDVTPAGSKFSAVDDMSGSGTGDDSTYISGSVAGDGQTFRYTAEASFTTALGYYLSASSLSTSASGIGAEAIAVNPDGGGETSMGDLQTYIAQSQSSQSNVMTTLPLGAALTQANFEAAEFGLKLKSYV